jgi:hypothetical protein
MNKCHALGPQFTATYDMTVSEEMDRLNSELVRLDKPWRFVSVVKAGFTLDLSRT